jgi:hypothetical protein
MIQKIQSSEYLKRLDNMTAEEKDDYMKRVGEWLEKQAPLLTPKTEEDVARFQNVIQCSAMWNDEECRAWTEGVRLLTAMAPSADTWLPDMLYVKAAKRAINQVMKTLPQPLPVMEGSGQTKTNIGSNQGSNQGSQPFRDIADGNQQGENKKEEVTTPLAHREGQGESPLGVGLPPVRPKHIDQYVHLLPKKTQEHAALVQGLYRELDEAREKMRLLAEDSTASPRDREAWGKKATKCDNALRKIFDELDAEWAKLVEEGKVVVDDLGNARVMEEVIVKSEKLATAAEDPQPNPADAPQTSSISPQTSVLEPQPSDPSPQTSKDDRKTLRKFLVDTRRGNGATRKEHVKKWKKNFKEYAKLVGEEAYKDEKLLEAAKHYEIDINKLK